MSFPLADSGNFTVGPSPVLIAGFVALVVVPIAVIVAVVRSRRGSTRDRAASTTWASAALVLSRAALSLIAIGFIVSVVHWAGSDWTQEDGPISGNAHRLSVRAESPDAMSLCPNRRVAGERGPTMVQQVECRASVAVDGSQPASGRVRGFMFDVQVPRPSAGKHRAFAAPEFGKLLILLIGALAIERILARTAARDPFSARSVVWLRVLAGVAFLTWLRAEFAQSFANALIRDHGQGAGTSDTMVRSINDVTGATFTGLAIAILILVLAEVWRFGIRLQEDVEATV